MTTNPTKTNVGALADNPRFNGYNIDPDVLTIVGLDTKDGPEHRLWDERIKRPLNEERIKNIMAIGVQEPIKIEATGTGENRRLLVVDGRRRVMHAREANKRLRRIGDPIIRVPVVVQGAENDKDIERVMIALNEQREDDDLMTKIRKAARMKQRGHTAGEIAISFGKAPETIEGWLVIHGLSEDVHKAITAGKISETAAFKLGALDKDDQAEALKKLVEEGGKLTVTRVATHVRKRKHGDDSRDTAPTKRLLTKIIDFIDGGENEKPVYGTKGEQEAFEAGLRFATGKLGAKSISGLSAVITAVTAPKPKKGKKNGKAD